MAYKVKINGIVYPIKDGFPLKQMFNDELDSGSIIFESKEKVDIKPFDNVKIFGDTNGNNILDKNLIIDNFIENITQFEPNFDYEYTINLMSETKGLERITLPSLSITKPKGKKNFSVGDFIFSLERYLPNIKVLSEDGNSWENYPSLSFDGSIKYIFNNECPEFSWNEPTLREVLDDLMMTKDCIARVENNVITFYNLKEKGQPILTKDIINMQTTMAASDYISDISITMKNSIGENLVRNCEYISLRSEAGEVTTENASLITNHPIYNIKSVKACLVAYIWSFDGDVKEYRYTEVDISDFIVEEDQFLILSNEKGETSSLTEAKKRKAYNLYYKRGTNQIKNFGSVTWFKDTLFKILRLCGKYQYAPTGGLNYDPYYKDMREIAFKVEYETLADRKMKVGKYLPVRNGENAIYDNQTSSYVNVQQQSIFEYAKANRLGNEIKVIYAEYKSENDMPRLGDYIDDYVLFSIETAYYDGYIEFKGTLTKNYVLRNYFTGVQSKRRTWSIAKGNEALTRYDITKIYCEFSFNEKNDNILDGNQYDLARMLVTPIYPDARDLEIRNVIVYTADVNSFTGKETKIPENAFGYIIDSSIEAQGMSLCINFGFNDNYSAGNGVYTDGSLYRNLLLRYTDLTGHFDKMYINIYSRIDPTEGKFYLPPNNAVLAAPIAVRDNIGAMAKAKPVILEEPTTLPLISFAIGNYNKDNREIIKHTIQFEFCSDTKDIIATELFAKYQNFIKKHSEDIKIYTSKSENDKYEIGDNKGKGSISDTATLFVNTMNDNVIQIFVDDTTKIYAWALCDSKRNIILAANASNNVAIYLNLLSSRDDNVYDDYYERNVVGKMWQYEKPQN